MPSFGNIIKMKQQALLSQRSPSQNQLELCYKIKTYPVYLSPNIQKPSQFVELQIGQRYLTIGSKKGPSTQILIEDLIGVHKEIALTKQEWVVISINAYVKRKKWFRAQRRYLQNFKVYYSLMSSSKNKDASQPQQQLQELVENLKRAACNRTDISNLRLMIYFNPAAGSNSKKHFQNTIDFLRLTNFTFDILQTKHQNHCREHIDLIQDIQKYESVVIISGDGLMHQFVNSKASLRVPVTHVPAGSANAFAKTQTSIAGELCGDYEAIYLVVKGRKKKFNIAEFELQNVDHPVYSFLSFQWAMMADIDINSEFLRFLGGLRFEVYALWRLIRMKRYLGRFSFSNEASDIPPLNQDILVDDERFVSKEQTHLLTIMTLIPFISDKYQFSPLLRIEDEKMEVQIVKEENGRWNLIKLLLNSDSGDHFDRKKQTVKQGYGFSWERMKSFRLEPIGQQRGVYAIDGERYDAQKLQCKMSSRKIISFV